MSLPYTDPKIPRWKLTWQFADPSVPLFEEDEGGGLLIGWLEWPLDAGHDEVSESRDFPINSLIDIPAKSNLYQHHVFLSQIIFLKTQLLTAEIVNFRSIKSNKAEVALEVLQ